MESNQATDLTPVIEEPVRTGSAESPATGSVPVRNEVPFGSQSPSVEAFTAAGRAVSDVQKGIRSAGGITKWAIGIAAVIVVVAFFFSSRAISNARDTVYVIDNQSRLEAVRADGGQQRDLEAVDHVTRFHEKFYNLAPNMSTISENVSAAMLLADEQVVLMDNARRERQFYTNLVKLGMVEEIHVDSVSVDMGTYPYPVHTWGKLYLIRSSNITRYDYESTCRLINVPRSRTNPHGLRIERFQEKTEISGKGQRK